MASGLKSVILEALSSELERQTADQPIDAGEIIDLEHLAIAVETALQGQQRPTDGGMPVGLNSSNDG